ncbi:alpha-amylase family glycosyl hydrolase [Sediminitomix flava]|uniref:Maltogenic amylase n=1 Tax=Sediminitomix flava TaxID=379075 RepID=A0A315Z7L4_SEDFL|nr:alpha-amylase family glycosyl hydrolase [Sediminitomix flava]PWJ40144.1 maltogenic amylase [Sediminitomix flava]
MKSIYLSAIAGLISLASCQLQGQDKPSNQNPYEASPYVKLEHPEWSKNATIYEANIRQFTEEGTFKAFEEHLPRLKKMGIDIIWLMPIHPIGEKNRKGELGSYYAVKDYYAVNPEFGTMDDLKSLVKKIHDMDMHVIIDWVGNHSAWDNKLTEEHPEWYTRDHNGEFRPTPWYDWDDIIDFDYEQEGIREYMTGALKFWVEEADIDGYRCDVAGFMPTDFWDQVRKELDEIKPVFMLAEWESRDLHQHAFDMTYSWSLYEKLHETALGHKTVNQGLYEYFAHHENTFPENAYRMNFVDNHDKNSWEGTMFSQFGKALDASIVLTCVADGMPLVYTGQEAGMDKQLKFFDKDIVEWKDSKYADLYTKLFELKHKNKSLWNGKYGGEMIAVVHDKPKSVLAFTREKDGDKVFVAFNFSDKEQKAQLSGNNQYGDYTDYFSGEKVSFKGGESLTIPAYGYKVFVK